MELDAKTLAVLILIFVVLFKLIWDLFGGIDDAVNEFWQEIKRKGTNLDEEIDEDDRNQSRKK